MKQQPNSIRFPHPFSCGIHLYVLLTVLLFARLSMHGQSTELAGCTTGEYPFSGEKAPTLCEKYSGITCDWEIGAGTLYPKASDIGAVITGNVCITGDFEIDQYFTFEDAIVKINPGVAINVDASLNYYDPGSGLTVRNSNLFACDGLWKGITVGFLASIYTTNSKIEDAENAIYSEALSALTINQTTFNRNRVGVHLVTPFPSVFVPGPLVWTFTNNVFSCDSPLNGTANEITFAGVQLENSYLYTFQNIGINRFRDLQYGIYSKGTASHIGANRLYFQRIKRDGIYMEHGSIKLDQSQFINCEENGINIGKAQLVDVRTATILLNSSIPQLTGAYRNGVYIGGFTLNADVHLGVGFNANLPNTQNQVRGIHLNGGIGNVGAGTHIVISGGGYTIRARPSSGIYINNMFPESSDLHIFDNDFDCATYPGANSWSHDIEASGEMNNLHIYGNNFNTGANAERTYAIYLHGSNGLNNEVTDNRFYPDQNATNYTFLWLIDFQNTKICSNIGGSIGASRGYYFWGTNTGTDYTGNEIHVMGEGVHILNGGAIGPQVHKGNKWFPLITPFLIFRASPHAIVDAGGNPLFSKFTVHTPQSTFVTYPNGSGEYTFFSEFHPENVVPDVMNEFFDIDLSGTPEGGCITRLTGPGDSDGLDMLIATNQFPGGTNAAAISQNWTGKRFLYSRLKQNPAYVSASQAFSSFLSSNLNSNIGRFHAVERKIEESIAGDAATTSAGQALIAQRLAQFSLIAAVDAQIETNTNPAALTALLQQKEQLIIGAMQQQTQYASLNSNYQIKSLQGLGQALTMNQAIVATQLHEVNEKAINNIALQSAVNQSGSLTEIQITELEGIAVQCSETGGNAVWNALAMLSDCRKATLSLCQAPPSDSPAPVAAESESKDKETPKSLSDQVIITPNPASTNYTIHFPQQTSGQMYLMDITGKVLREKRITGDTETESTEHLQSGTYLLKIVLDNGTTVAKRLIIAK